MRQSAAVLMLFVMMCACIQSGMSESTCLHTIPVTSSSDGHTPDWAARSTRSVTTQPRFPSFFRQGSKNPPTLFAPLSGSNKRVEIDLVARTLKVFESGIEIASFSVGVGKEDTPSPVGTFFVRRKSANWGGGFGVRFIELDVPWGVFGIHGTNKPYSVGDRLSGGCFRMHNQDVLELYSLVEVGTKVLIFDPSGAHLFKRGLSIGSRGSDVFLLQKGLERLGYLDEKPDGIFGQKTKSALMRFQSMHGLAPTGSFCDATREIAYLRIIEGWPETSSFTDAR